MVFPKRRCGEVRVVPLDFFIRAESDMDTGGKFLRGLVSFFQEYEQGQVDMAHTGRGFEQPINRPSVSLEEVELLRCPLGVMQRHGPFMTSWNGGRIISRTKVAKVLQRNRRSVRESE